MVKDWKLFLWSQKKTEDSLSQLLFSTVLEVLYQNYKARKENIGHPQWRGNCKIMFCSWHDPIFKRIKKKFTKTSKANNKINCVSMEQKWTIQIGNGEISSIYSSTYKRKIFSNKSNQGEIFVCWKLKHTAGES